MRMRMYCLACSSEMLKTFLGVFMNKFIAYFLFQLALLLPSCRGGGDSSATNAPILPTTSAVWDQTNWDQATWQ